MTARREGIVICAWETPLRKMAGQGTAYKKKSHSGLNWTLLLLHTHATYFGPDFQESVLLTLGYLHRHTGF